MDADRELLDGVVLRRVVDDPGRRIVCDDRSTMSPGRAHALVCVVWNAVFDAIVDRVWISAWIFFVDVMRVGLLMHGLVPEHARDVGAVAIVQDGIPEEKTVIHFDVLGRRA